MHEPECIFFVYKTMQVTCLGTDATTHAILHIYANTIMSINWLRCFLYLDIYSIKVLPPD